MKPTAAEIENGMSRTIKANIPPVNASGTPVNIINEYTSKCCNTKKVNHFIVLIQSAKLYQNMPLEI